MRSRRHIAAAVVCGALLLLSPQAAFAHATLESTQPERGVTLAKSPAQVEFVFDEPVEGNFGSARVFDAQGRRVEQGAPFHPGGEGKRLAVKVRPDLKAGTYTATYRVVSADSHIVAGGFVFSVGHPTAAAETVEQLVGRSGVGPVTRTAFIVARAVQYGALALAAGVLVFLLVVWHAALRSCARAGSSWREASAAFLRRARVLVLSAAVAGTLSALGAVVLEAAAASGLTAWSALRPSILREVVGTKFGTIWTIAALCWLAIGVIGVPLLAGTRRRAPVLQPASLGATGAAPPRSPLVTLLPLLVPLGFLCLVPALSGHGSTQSPTAVMFTANAVHVMAMACWVGGLAALLFAVPAATRRLEARERSVLLSAVLVRFSTLALGAVIVLLVTGLVQSYIEIGRLDLVLTTAFGRAVLIKTILLAVLIVLGAVHRRRTIPAMQRAAATRRSPGEDGLRLRRLLRGEIALVAVVLVVTGALAGYPPPSTAAAGPYSTTTRIGAQDMQLTVDPARVGANQVHLYLTDPDTGAPVDRAKEVQVSAVQPDKQIGPINARASKAGPGHYVLPGLVLGVPGDWKLTVSERVSEFDEYTATLKVPVQ